MVDEELVRLISMASAALCVGIGAIGPAIGAGITGAQGVVFYGRKVETRSIVMKIMLIGMAIAGSTGIYALVVGLLLLYVV